MSAHLQIPQILSVSANFVQGTWTVFYPEEYHSFLVEHNALQDSILQSIQPYISLQNLPAFRLQLSLDTVPCLVGIFPQSREIRILSARAARELFLLREVVEESAELQNLRKHVIAVSSLKAAELPSIWERVTQQYHLPDLLHSTWPDVQTEQAQLEKKVLKLFSNYKPKIFERLSDFALGLSADYALVRIHLLKFLAILPSLDHDKNGHEVKRIFIESFRRLLDDAKRLEQSLNTKHKKLPLWFRSSIKAALFIGKIIPGFILAAVIRKSVKILALRFIAGESIEKATLALKQLMDSKRDATLDQLGELVVSELEATHYEEQVLKLIRGFSLHVKAGERNVAGILRAHVSIKISALTAFFNPEAPDATFATVGPRLKRILLAAKEHQVFINVDAEHYDYRDLSFYLFKRVMLETPELADFADAGIVVQAYLRDAYPHFQEILRLAQARKLCMPIRLVKGAYWDAETIHADAHHYVAPQFLNKEESDLHFRQLVIKTLEASPHLQLCLGSHNVADHCFAESLRNTKYPQALPIEHQCLHMTFEPLSVAMAEMGWAVRNYIPIGSLLVGMAYLVRRIMENSSQVGVLTQMRQYRSKYQQTAPEQIHLHQKVQGTLTRDLTERPSPHYANVAPVRLYLNEERKKFQASLTDFAATLPLTSSQENSFVGEEHKVFSPSYPEREVGKIRQANLETAQAVLTKVDQAYQTSTWVSTTAIARASVLLKAAEICLSRRLQLASLIVAEAGKHMNEALGDVDEAIDFLNFYAREEVRLSHENKKSVSRGVVVVISPWNFPLAIPCGMVAGSLVAGNAVILKPAEQTPLIAAEFAKILYDAGVPRDIFQYLPGKGSIVGKMLVEDARVSTIVFTGSKSVGLWIAETAGKRVYHNRRFGFHIPVKVIAEMGGKNAIVITQNAEIDEAVAGVIYSAFGHAGQKCSAASRVLVHESLKEGFAARLAQALHDLRVGRADDFSIYMNPVVSAADKARLQAAVLESHAEVKASGGKVWADRSQENLPGCAIGPALIEVPYHQALKENSFARQELFGPVLHLIPYATLKDAVFLFNATEYALTGGIYSQSQDDTDYLLQHLQAGNLYVNRPCTGARVGVEPFGGFKHSGTGPKAGGIHYVPAFHVNLDAVETLPKALSSGKPLADQAVKICTEFQDPTHEYVQQIAQVLDKLIAQVPYIFVEQAHSAQVVLEWWKEWLHEDGKNYFWKHHWNQRVPGQLSFNDLRQSKDLGVLLAMQAQPQLPSLLFALSALLSGSSLTILCRDQESALVWKVLEAVLRNCGISAEHCAVFACDEQTLQQTLSDSRIEFCILDGDPLVAQKFLAYFMSGKSLSMRSVFTLAEAPDMRDPQRYLDNFVYVRSFAINTMRHGAPLEVEWQ